MLISKGLPGILYQTEGKGKRARQWRDRERVCVCVCARDTALRGGEDSISKKMEC